MSSLKKQLEGKGNKSAKYSSNPQSFFVLLAQVVNLNIKLFFEKTGNIYTGKDFFYKSTP